MPEARGPWDREAGAASANAGHVQVDRTTEGQRSGSGQGSGHSRLEEEWGGVRRSNCGAVGEEGRGSREPRLTGEGAPPSGLQLCPLQQVPSCRGDSFSGPHPPPAPVRHWGPFRPANEGALGLWPELTVREVPRCVRSRLRTTAGPSGAQVSARAEELGSRWPGPTRVTWTGPSPAPLPRVQLTRTLLSQGPNSEKQHLPWAARAAVHTQVEGTDGGGLGPSEQGQHLAGKRRLGHG